MSPDIAGMRLTPQRLLCDANPCSEFVREHYAQTKRELGPVSGGEVMRALAQQWRERKQAVGASTL